MDITLLLRIYRCGCGMVLSTSSTSISMSMSIVVLVVVRFLDVVVSYFAEGVEYLSLLIRHHLSAA